MRSTRRLTPWLLAAGLVADTPSAALAQGYPVPHDHYPGRGYPTTPYPDRPGYPGGWGGYGYRGPAFDNGFADGYREGLDDARDRDRYEPEREKRYRKADRGYDRRYGPKEYYKQSYRDGFRRGYDRGYRDARYGWYGTRPHDRRSPYGYERWPR
jgi:hypothetical protein